MKQAKKIIFLIIIAIMFIGIMSMWNLSYADTIDKIYDTQHKNASGEIRLISPSGGNVYVLPQVGKVVTIAQDSLNDLAWCLCIQRGVRFGTQYLVKYRYELSSTLTEAKMKEDYARSAGVAEYGERFAVNYANYRNNVNAVKNGGSVITIEGERINVPATGIDMDDIMQIYYLQSSDKANQEIERILGSRQLSLEHSFIILYVMIEANIVYKANAVPYVLTRKEDTSISYNHDATQIAMWALSDYEQTKDLSDTSDAERFLYKEAVAYASYRANYSGPSVASGTPSLQSTSGNYAIIGPYKVNYSMKSFSTSTRTVVFGGIRQIEVVGKNGNVPNDAWTITNRAGTTTISGSGYNGANIPASGTEFYIKLDLTRIGNATGIDKVNIKFNDEIIIDANYVELHTTSTGTTYQKLAVIDTVTKTSKTIADIPFDDDVEFVPKLEYSKKLVEINRDGTRITTNLSNQKVQAEDILTYEWTVQNTGQGPYTGQNLTNKVIEDKPTSNMTYRSSGSASGWVKSGSQYNLDLSTKFSSSTQLSPGASVTYKIVFKVDLDATGTVKNNTIGNSLAVPKLEYSKKLVEINRNGTKITTNLTNQTVQAGDKLTYEWTVKNIGESPYIGQNLSNKLIKDTPNTNLTYVSTGSESGWTRSGSQYQLDLSTKFSSSNKLAVNATKGFKIVFEVDINDPNNLEVDNNGVGNTVVVPELHVEKFTSKRVLEDGSTVEYNRQPTVTGSSNNYTYSNTSDPMYAKKGDKITYTIRVYNEGKGDYYGKYDREKKYNTSEIGKIKDTFGGISSLKILSTTQSSLNRTYAWTSSGTDSVTSTYLYSTANIVIPGVSGNNKPSYVDLHIEFEVTAELFKVVVNKADTDPPPPPPPGDPDPPTETVIPNYVEVSGRVWIDGRVNKDSNNDSIMNISSSSPDVVKPGVLVALRYKDGPNKGKLVQNPVDPTISRGTDYQIQNPTVTDSNGNYTFENIFISATTIKKDSKGNITKYEIKDGTANNLNDFYVEFYYDGMTYVSVDINKGGATNSSRASEVNRQLFNNKFAEIIPGYAKIASGKSAVNFNRQTVEMENYTGNNGLTSLEYWYPNNGQSGAKLEKYNANSRDANNGQTKNEFEQNGTMNIKSKFVISSSTSSNTSISIKFYNTTSSGGTSTPNGKIQNINLGILQRNDFDLMLRKDLYETEMTINNGIDTEDFKEVYVYDSRQKSEMEILLKDSDIRGVRVIDASNEGLYDLNVRETDLNYIKGIDVTYKISIVDQTSSVKGSVTEIKDYYDPRLQPEEIKLDLGNGNYMNLSFTANSGEMIITIPQRDNAGNRIYAKEEGLDIYVRYSVIPVEINKIKNGTTILNIYNYAEINKYMTFNTSGSNTEGMIDRDSAPGTFTKSKYESSNVNINQEYKNMYNAIRNNPSADVTALVENIEKKLIPIFEDDSDRAPGLIIQKSQEKRELTGNVWEDTTELNQYKERIANGIKGKDNNGNNINETGIENVEVTLLWTTDGSQVTLPENAIRTDENGNYKITSYLPGNYTVRFKYGDMAENVSGLTQAEILEQEIKYNGQDYKSTKYDAGQHPAYSENSQNSVYWYTLDNNLSDARDDMGRRRTVNNYSTELKNWNAEVLASKRGQGFIDSTHMLAYTDNMRMEVEYATQSIDYNGIQEYKVKNVDFGIAVRAKSQLMLIKRAESIKVVLQDNSIHANTSEATKNIAWIKKSTTNDAEGMIQVTLDENLISGAIIEVIYSITITNMGEVDYTVKDASHYDKFYYEYVPGDQNVVVRTRADLIIDYPSNTYRFVDDKTINQSAADGEGWSRTSTTTLKGSAGSDPFVANTISANDLDLFDTKLLLEERESRGDKYETKTREVFSWSDEYSENPYLAPGESMQHLIVLENTMHGENSSDDLVYENMVELLKSSNTIGRKMEESISGNLNPIEPETGLQEPDASQAETSSILPPFGDTKISYILSIASMLLIIIGVIVIKKKII